MLDAVAAGANVMQFATPAAENKPLAEESSGDSSEGSSDEEHGLKGMDAKPGFPYLKESSLIPYRSQQVLISWIFIVASVALILDFASLQTLMHSPDLEHPEHPWFVELCNWFGVLSCFCWFLGFVLLVHWLHSVGATKLGLAGAYMKLLAAIFFNLQPLTGTMNDAMLGGPAGLWWSNLVGIILFHVGNIISCVDFYLNVPPGGDKSKNWLFHGNLPITGMWMYQLATWFLVASNSLACAPPGVEGFPLVPVGDSPVPECQFFGAFGLLFGSVIYAVWCSGFHNFSNPPLQ